MPIPFLLLGGAVASGIIGAVKGGEAMSKNSQAKEIVEKAQRNFNNKKKQLEMNRDDTSRSLEQYGKLKIRIWDEQFSRFLDLYQNFKNVRIEGNPELDQTLKSSLTQEKLSEMRTLSVTAGELVAGGLGALGTGALAGVASYGGAMVFASASTGTAIASLSGAAATNATLAWFGGGSLAVGGFGMAGGAVVLGGLVAGPIIAVGGFFMAAKANKNLDHARKKKLEARKAIEQMNNAISLLNRIKGLAKQYYDFAVKLNNKFIDLMDEMELLIFDRKNDSEKIDYNTLNEIEKRLLQENIIAVQLMKVLLEKPLMDEEGNIQQSSVNYINELPENPNRMLPQ